MAGSRLKPLALTTMPWGQWKGLHADTFLITGSQGGQETQFAAARYSGGVGSGYQDRTNKGQFAFPVDEDKLDGRLSAGEIVSIVEAGETRGLALAFPLGLIGDSAANADVGGPLTCARLKRMSGRRAFWLSVAILFPGTGIHNLPYFQPFIPSSA